MAIQDTLERNQSPRVSCRVLAPVCRFCSSSTFYRTKLEHEQRYDTDNVDTSLWSKVPRCRRRGSYSVPPVSLSSNLRRRLRTCNFPQHSVSRMMHPSDWLSKRLTNESSINSRDSGLICCTHRARPTDSGVRVLNDRRKPIGYLNIPNIKTKFERGEAGEEDPLCLLTTRRFPKHHLTGCRPTYNPFSPIQQISSIHRHRTAHTSRRA